jgi:TorA maturation chaperone TorD
MPAAEHAPLIRLLDLGEAPTVAEHSDLFLFQLYPYASVYLNGNGMLGGDAEDRVVGFLRALGLKAAPEPDHLTSLLAVYAGLSERVEAVAGTPGEEIWKRAQRTFLYEHLLSWLPVYLLRLQQIASPFYRRWGELLTLALSTASAAVEPPPEQPLSLPPPLRQVPAMADPRQAGSEAFSEALLAPLSSGLILVRDDLLRCARDCGVGARAGERRYVLKALLGQEPARVIAWLAEEAESWGKHIDEFLVDSMAPGQVKTFWRQRALDTAGLLRNLGCDLEPGVDGLASL